MNGNTRLSTAALLAVTLVACATSPTGRRQLALVSEESAIVASEEAYAMQIGERADLVELHGDEEDGSAGVAQLDEAPVDRFDRADVDAARRLADQQYLGLARHLARQDQFLLVAAREVR